MAARKPTTEERLKLIRGIRFNLAEQLEKHSPQTIAQVHDALQQTIAARLEPFSLALALEVGLGAKELNAGNLPQILPVVQQTIRAGYNPANLVSELNLGLGGQNRIFKGNLPQLLLVIQQTITAGHNPTSLVQTLHYGSISGHISRGNLPRVLELASRHAKKGKNPFVLALALQTPHLPPTPENLAALRKAEPHVLHAYSLPHNVKSITRYEEVLAPLFAHIIETYKTMPPKIGKEKYWQHLKRYAKKLEASKQA